MCKCLCLYLLTLNCEGLCSKSILCNHYTYLLGDIMNYAMGCIPFMSSLLAQDQRGYFGTYICEMMKTGCQEGCNIKLIHINRHYTVSHCIGKIRIVLLKRRNPQLSQWCLEKTPTKIRRHRISTVLLNTQCSF